MGFETFIYSNPENTIYAWMQKVFPSYSAWVKAQLEGQDPQMLRFLEPRAVELVNILDGELPPEDVFRRRFSDVDAVELLESIFFDYCGSIRVKDEACDCLKEIAYFRKNLMFYHLSMLLRIFENALSLERIAYLVGAYSGRVFSDSEGARDSENHILPLLYWSHEECMELRQALRPLFDQEHPLFLEHESRLIEWFELDEDQCYDDPTTELIEIRSTSQSLHAALTQLQHGEGAILYFSF